MSKSKSKAKRSRAKRSSARPHRGGQLALPLGSPGAWPRVDRDLTGRGIVTGKPETFPPGTAMDAKGWPVFNLVMKQPHPRAGVAIQRELAQRQRERERREAHDAKVNRRPADMREQGYRLPDDVRTFLRRLYPTSIAAGAEWEAMQAVGWPDDNARLHRQLHDVLAAAVEAAYMEGCRQGYIEGFVVRREVDRQRSRAGNAGKRKAVVTVGTRAMSRDERDATMAAEHAALLKLMKPTPACERLAEKYGFESWQGVAAAIKRFRQRAGE